MIISSYMHNQVIILRTPDYKNVPVASCCIYGMWRPPMLLFSECTHRIAQVATVTMRHISLQLQSWNYQCWKQRFAKISQTITEKPLLTRRALIWLKALIGALSMIVITSQMFIYSSRNYIFTPVVAGCSWRGWRRAHSVREESTFSLDYDCYLVSCWCHIKRIVLGGILPCCNGTRKGERRFKRRS